MEFMDDQEGVLCDESNSYDKMKWNEMNLLYVVTVEADDLLKCSSLLYSNNVCSFYNLLDFLKHTFCNNISRLESCDHFIAIEYSDHKGVQIPNTLLVSERVAFNADHRLKPDGKIKFCSFGN